MKTTIKRRLFAFCASVLYVLSAGQTVLADDTEVLLSSSQANILFIMDTSGSMDWDIAHNTPRVGPSRLSIVQGVFSDLMTDYSGFNVALMRFNNGGNGGYFVSPMKPLNSTTRSSIIAAGNGLSAQGNTPLSETFYEAALYWSGSAVNYGTGNNVAGVAAGGNYISPITSQCQKNYTIYLTDGAPNGDNNADSDIATLTGSSCSGNCLDEVASYLNTVDQSAGASGITGTQTVETYTIGFTSNQTLLEAAGLAGGGTATAGGGNDHYIVANDAPQLKAAFEKILDTINTNSINSFSPAAITANAFNGISHFNKLYFALYEPSSKPNWIGNVKPFIINSAYKLEDADGNVAVDANGLFKASSRSFWSSSADGGSILAGGANGMLPGAASRNLYTYTGDYTVVAGVLSDSTLSDTRNALENSVGSNLTPAMLGLTTPAEIATFDTVLDRTRAPLVGSPAVATPHLGAPLHSSPVLVTYDGPATNPDLTLFVAANDGFLHALNAKTGVEQFAFIPQELLPKLPDLASTGSGPRVYGLDGAITTWVKDVNADHTIDSTAGDHVYVYVGMRRGGNNYYALDVTNRATPKLKWAIKGGTGAGHTPGFEELGQSWSKPTLTTIKYGAGTRKVLIFAGGYDTAQDANPLNNDADTTNDDTIGRAVFIVDADDGSLLWYASPTVSPTAPASAIHYPMTELTHSIPSDVRPLDTDLDGNTDRLYVGDMRGQVLRFDLQNSATAMTGSGYVLARLGDNDEANNRRFYYPPDVVVTQKNGSATPYISLNIGSGYRAHPLNPTNPNGTPAARVDDRFYSLRDTNVLTVPAVPPAPITNAPADLLDVTAKPVLNSSDTTTLENGHGWYVTLGAGNGEKVLAPSITISGEIFFTTYTPPSIGANNSCSPPTGSGKLYRVSLFDGSPVVDQDGDGNINSAADRSAATNSPGLSGSFAMFYQSPGSGGGGGSGGGSGGSGGGSGGSGGGGGGGGKVELLHCEGTECTPPPNAIQIQPTYWLENS